MRTAGRVVVADDAVAAEGSGCPLPLPPVARDPAMKRDMVQGRWKGWVDYDYPRGDKNKNCAGNTSLNLML